MTPEAELAPLDVLEADLLIEAIWRHYHYDFRGYSRNSLHRRLLRAQPHLGCESFSQMQHIVLRSPAAFGELMRYLTIQVSEMFRDPDYFRALREQVIPHLRTYPSIKVWIAGCANGEEFYSMAILFREEGLEERTIFYCTDISPGALNNAQSGVYEQSRIAKFTENHRLSGGHTSLSDYYTAAYGGVVFDKSLRSRAVFAEHSLATDQVFAEAHLISSRNVLIYFDRDLQDRAIDLFANSLVRGGYLGLGSRETLRFSRTSGCFDDFVPQEKIYRRNLVPSQEPGHVA
ncbi:chemotaxis protein methyltransferase CheR [Sphingobium sp. B2D3A]|uniref:CheR family methyltransferase n=1 Tax=unclassified Sphingobium TaxID=2611147 RepID=UPI0022244066|nr:MULTISPECIES: CheR family methyltransferase [unclassified Sphingobium]MCW2336670.1 chemotaxis protein methyltransferase CheR [Sphingobium sp. B2D3A]MCW2349108.1 chemotaxis protein methyltransferase CheR [Sphingobium sp. B12D2B]MCW2367656.1 chemotaxis protein methyltransferase CheR [Sphingobium sp. B7D2B]MCW2368237.1 chemotaxis protein methyltransferase CheR [Sphingobium sp. B11D3D]MCW2386424.1 chemotaxis protein methyltransferase CheR [Sphingobium sp. B2D3D]